MPTGGIVWLGAMAYVRMRIFDKLRVLLRDLKRCMEVGTGESIANDEYLNTHDFATLGPA